MGYRVKGTLKLPDGSPASNAEIEFISRKNFSPLLQELKSNILCGPSGDYDVTLEFGEHAVLVYPGGTYPAALGTIILATDTVTGQDLPTLLQQAGWQPATPEYIQQIAGWLVEANNSATNSSASASAAKASETNAKASELAAESDRAEVAANSASVDAKHSEVVSKAAIVDTKTAQVIAAESVAVAAADAASQKASDAAGHEAVSLDAATRAENAALSMVGAIIDGGECNLSGGVYPQPVSASGITYSTVWFVAVGGTVGGATYDVGDQLRYTTANSGYYFRVDAKDDVYSVNGEKGAVTVTPEKIGAEASGVASQLVMQHEAKPSAHAISGVIGLQDALDSKYSASNKPSMGDVTGLVDAISVVEIRGDMSPFRNKIQNGKFEVSQRGFSVPLPISSTAATIDRFNVGNSTAARGFANQSIVDPSYPNPSIRKCMNMTVTTPAPATVPASQHLRIAHIIEGFEVRPLSASPFVLSFTAKTTVAGTYTIALRNSSRNKTILRSYTLPANTWKRVVLPFSALPSGFITDWENGLGLEVCWTLAAGADLFGSQDNVALDGALLAVAGQVVWGRSVSDTFAITEVQLEVGEVATSFEHRPYSVELALCQRYLLNLGFDEGASGTLAAGGTCTDGVCIISIYTPTQMRGAPTYEGGTLICYSGNGAIGAGAVALSRRGSSIMVNQTMAGAAGQAAYLACSQNSGFRGFSSELV